MSTTVTVCEYWRGPCQEEATHKLGRFHYCKDHYSEACDESAMAAVQEEEEDMLWPEERNVVIY